MEIRLGSEAVEDLIYIKKNRNKKILNRIDMLIKSILISPFKGLENLNH